LLADGVYRSDQNDEFRYEQRVGLGTGMVLEFFKDSNHEDNTPSLGINLSSGQMLFNYSLNFITEPASTVTSGKLVDFQNTELNLLGRSYFISSASNGSQVDLTLLDSANTGFVSEGETVTINVGGKAYQVSIEFVSTSETILVVNGERTNTMSEGQTYKLSDGTFVGIKDILAREVAGVLGKVEFSLGSGKIELRGGNTIRLNDKSVNAVTSEITKGTPASGEEKIRRINLVWTLDDDEFITPDTSLVLPGFENVKFSMEDLIRPAEEVTRVEKGSSSYMTLKTEIKDGSVTIPFLYTSNGDFVGLGEDSSRRLVTKSSGDLVFNASRGDRWFVASWNSSNSAESYLVQIGSGDFTTEDGRNKTTVRVWKDGTFEERCPDREPSGTATCNLGPVDLTITNVNYAGRTANFTIGNGGSFGHLYTKEGLKVFLPVEGANQTATPGSINLTNNNLSGHNNDTFNLVFVESNKDNNVAQGSQFNVAIAHNSDNEVETTTLSGFRTETNPDDSDHIMGYVYSDLATKVERFGRSSDQRYAVVSYAGGESYADVFLTATTGTGSGSTSLGQINVMASELPNSGMQTKNLIIVGGSCVNSAASTVLGLSGPSCGSSWTARTGAGQGSWVIETFANPWSSSKVATLVAGYETDDTKNAATYLSTQSVDTTVSKKYTGTSATSATLVTA